MVTLKKKWQMSLLVCVFGLCFVLYYMPNSVLYSNALNQTALSKSIMILTVDNGSDPKSSPLMDNKWHLDNGSDPKSNILMDNKLPLDNWSDPKSSLLMDNKWGLEKKLQRSSSGTTEEKLEGVTRKLILFWNKWFTTDWIQRFRDQNNLKSSGCPSHDCQFTYNSSRMGEADAIVFAPGKFEISNTITRPNLQQRWIFVDVESPMYIINSPSFKRTKYHFNWTMTYHSSADILAFYGYFTPRRSIVRSIRPNFMAYESETMKAYLRDLESNRTSDFLNSDFISSLAQRPRLGAWMCSHCPTYSKREQLIAALQKYIPIGTYGKCGELDCGKLSPYDGRCWLHTLAPKYLFYFSFENSLCDEYITEKLYNPLLYGLVPVVYGGSNYSRFLPPHSYIDASHYSTQGLAKLLLKLQKFPEVYKRYHLWRKYWKVNIGGSFCELCHKLYTDTRISRKKYFFRDRQKNEHCFLSTENTFRGKSTNKQYNYIQS